jgi:hypothetical protein
VQKWLLAEVFFLAHHSARFLIVKYHPFRHSVSLGRGPGDIDQIVRDNPQPNPSLHAIVPLVPASKETMPSLEHTNPPLAPSVPTISETLATP